MRYGLLISGPQSPGSPLKLLEFLLKKKNAIYLRVSRGVNFNTHLRNIITEGVEIKFEFHRTYPLKFQSLSNLCLVQIY